MPSSRRQCLNCGMTVAVETQGLHERRPQACPKCDEDLFAQTDGSTLTQDIAHQGETLEQAMDKLERILDRAWAGYTRQVRLVVGGGMIHDAALGHLHYLRNDGRILAVDEEGRNRGALLIRLRH